MYLLSAGMRSNSESLPHWLILIGPPRHDERIVALFYCHYSLQKFGDKDLFPLRKNISRPGVVSGAIFSNDEVYLWSLKVVFEFLSDPSPPVYEIVFEILSLFGPP